MILLKKSLPALALAVLLSGPVAAVDEPLPHDLMNHLRDVCDRYKVDIALVLSVMHCESGFNPDAINYDGSCVGLLQLSTRYAQSYADELGIEGFDVYDPYNNISTGVYLLAGYLAKYDVHRALASYNQGEYSATKAWTSGTTSTSYSRRVVARIEDYAEYRAELPSLRRPYEGRLAA